MNQRRNGKQLNFGFGIYKGVFGMTKQEMKDLESILVEIDQSDDRIDPICRLYSVMRSMYFLQCEKKLGHKPLDV